MNAYFALMNSKRCNSEQYDEERVGECDRKKLFISQVNLPDTWSLGKPGQDWARLGETGLFLGSDVMVYSRRMLDHEWTSLLKKIWTLKIDWILDGQRI